MAPEEADGSDRVAAAEQALEALGLFDAERAALDAVVSVLLKGELSAAVLTDATTALMKARSDLHELSERAKGPPPAGDFHTRADGLLALAFTQAWLGLVEAFDAVRGDPVGLPVAGIAQTTRQMERVRDSFREVLAARGRQQPALPRLRLFGDGADDAG